MVSVSWHFLSFLRGQELVRNAIANTPHFHRAHEWPRYCLYLLVRLVIHHPFPFQCFQRYFWCRDWLKSQTVNFWRHISDTVRNRGRLRAELGVLEKGRIWMFEISILLLIDELGAVFTFLSQSSTPMDNFPAIICQQITKAAFRILQAPISGSSFQIFFHLLIKSQTGKLHN